MKLEVSGNLALLLAIFGDQDTVDISGLKETVDELRATILSPIESQVLDMYFGLNANPPMTNEEIANILKVPPEKVALHLKTGLRRFRHPSRSRKLLQFIHPFVLKDKTTGASESTASLVEQKPCELAEEIGGVSSTATEMEETVGIEPQRFVYVVKDYENNKRKIPEHAFWESRSTLGGNFLAAQLSPYIVEKEIHRFLGLWRSYRHRIDWDKLVNSWTPEVQKVASSLSKRSLEDADDNTLARADRLYMHFVSSKIEGMGDTNISKVLSLSLPNLCIMWDSVVREDFLRNRNPFRISGHRPPLHSDYYHFLCQRRQVANDLIRQLVQKENWSRKKAITWLMQIPLQVQGGIGGGQRTTPLAKLLDEYYYSVKHGYA